MKKWDVFHSQDLKDAINLLEDIKKPYRIIAFPISPKKDTLEHETKAKQMAFFHRGVVPTYSSLGGLTEQEAKEDLQCRFALVEEWGDHFRVQSLSGMSIPRLAEFIEQCQVFLIQEFAVSASELLIKNIGKTKKIKKHGSDKRKN